jgi:hypothetical protein
MLSITMKRKKDAAKSDLKRKKDGAETLITVGSGFPYISYSVTSRYIRNLGRLSHGFSKYFPDNI